MQPVLWTILSIVGGAVVVSGATISIEPLLAVDDGSMNRFTKRARPFYGPDIDPGQAFMLSG